MPKVHIIVPTHKRPFFQMADTDEWSARFDNYDEPSQIVSAWQKGLRELHPTEVPSVVRLHKEVSLPDAFETINALLIVSEAFKDVLEAIDPGTHQFFPVDVTFPRMEKIEDKWVRLHDPVKGNWYILNVHTHKKTLVKSLSNVNQEQDGVRTQLHGGDAVFRKDALMGANIWREADIWRRYFISDRLDKILKEKKMKFLKRKAGRVLEE